MATLGDIKVTLSEQIVQKIMDDIKSGVLVPGEKLPSEKKLIEKFQVSRITVREALRTLQVMNIIDIQQGRGAFVTSTVASLLIDHMDFVSLLSQSTIDNLFEARRILEPEIAAIAAERITDEDIQELQSLLEQDNYDIKLHQKIAECTKNPVLIRFILSTWSLGELSRQMTSRLPGVKNTAYDNHVKLVEALSARDKELSRKLMTEHLQHVEDSYRKRAEMDS